ncbi:MAG: linked oxidase domain protein [Chloroflexi bacterium]|nr:linked oxidase domain protein [Chloroflexota bacterium]
MNMILEVDADGRQARVQPGVVLDHLRNAAERRHLTFAPDPSTHDHCTLGGMIGNNSCGVHSVTGGKTDDNVIELDVLTYDGERLRVRDVDDATLESLIAQGGRRGDIYSGLRDLRDRYAGLVRERYPQIPRRVSGYNLDRLLPEYGFNVARALVGTEGTCVTVLEATLRLVDSPPGRSLLVLGYPDVYAAGNAVMEVLAQGPLAVEGIDDRLVDAMRAIGMFVDDLALLPDGGSWLFVEFGGETRDEANVVARRAADALSKSANPPNSRIYDDPRQARAAWLIRQSAPRAASRAPGQPDCYEGWEDAAVPPDRLGPYLRDFRSLLDRHKLTTGIYGHFGQACIHTRIDFNMKTDDGVKQFRSFVEDAADLVVSYGGSLSGEHGDGQARAELLPRMYGEEIVGAFREFKTIWDPAGKMNPGKVVDPYPLDTNLRLGPSYHPKQLATHFAFADDEGSFSRAIERCIGIGNCRQTVGGLMCPSYVATMEEQHSTRGRARMLFEMLRGDSLSDGWHSEEVKEALDLCLACKGCKSECPAGVDMATYKAEFLSHYYEGKRRPMAANTFGLIPWWARIARWAPALANFATQTPLLRDIAKAVAGIAPQRQIPAFASQSFVDWFRKHPASPPSGERPTPTRSVATGEGAIKGPVLLWTDTFYNSFHPEVAQAAVDVLEAAGFHVEIPGSWLCCGRPLYDYGRLDLAKRMLRRIMEILKPQIAAGTPIVVLEPGCLSVFRDELANLFPTDPDARRLGELCLTFAELLERHAPDFELPRLDRNALFHVHCHQRSVIGAGPDMRLLARLGIDVKVPDAGCCGMAGAFGYEREHYEVSMRIAERALLPAIRNADDATLVIADGFSCRGQIAQGTGRQPLHLAQVVQKALRQQPLNKSLAADPAVQR